MSSVSKLISLLGPGGLTARNVLHKINSPNRIPVKLVTRWREFGLVKMNGINVRCISTSVTLFDETPIKMPALSPTMSSGTIVKWHKKEGDKISPGDVLCEVQTDKAVMAFEYDDEGVLAKIIIDENSKEIQVGSLIAIVCGEEDDWRNVKIPQEAIADTNSNVSTESTAKVQENVAKNSAESGGVVASKIAPSARNLLHHYGLDSGQVKATGRRGALLKEDVLNYIAANKLVPKTATASESSKASGGKAVSASPAALSSTPYVDHELTSMRKTIAKRLTESKFSTPHSYISINCFMDDLLKLRSQLKHEGTKVSVNDLLVKSVALALKQVPEMNCQFDAASGEVRLLPQVDISVAVATPTGLITPIIFNANRLSLEEINATSQELIVRAKAGKLQPNEFVGGSFSISNLGMFDVDHFTAVINPPQAAILAVGATKKMFVGEPDAYQLCSRMTITMSYDGRAIDEEIASTFMEKVKGNIEKPSVLLHSDGTSHRRLATFL